MALLALLVGIPPGHGGRDEFDFWHARDHQDIRDGIQSFGGPNLPSYILDPIASWGAQPWAQAHQQAHNDMNGALDLQGIDLLDVNWQGVAEEDEWLFHNFMEHAAAHQATGIP